MQVLLTVLHPISYGAYKENLCSNQELLKLMIISFIPMTLMVDSVVILLGEMRCLSLREG